jgi:hypothetical protein
MNSRTVAELQLIFPTENEVENALNRHDSLNHSGLLAALPRCRYIGGKAGLIALALFDLARADNVLT